jgi:hypothetical protein
MHVLLIADIAMLTTPAGPSATSRDSDFAPFDNDMPQTLHKIMLYLYNCPHFRFYLEIFVAHKKRVITLNNINQLQVDKSKKILFFLGVT